MVPFFNKKYFLLLNYLSVEKESFALGEDFQRNIYIFFFFQKCKILNPPTIFSINSSASAQKMTRKKKYQSNMQIDYVRALLFTFQEIKKGSFHFTWRLKDCRMDIYFCFRVYSPFLPYFLPLHNFFFLSHTQRERGSTAKNDRYSQRSFCNAPFGSLVSSIFFFLIYHLCARLER